MNAGKRKVWFITGAGRGMGADFARAVLAAGHALVATGRDTERLSKALGRSKELLTVKLDVTSRADAEAAVRAAAERFGRIDVLSTTQPASTRDISRSSRRSRSISRLRRPLSAR
jgi:NADP-dependent 3-hydroxy acid dehydrogenase YdfG